MMRRRPVAKIGETLESIEETRIHLCGQLTLRLRGRRLEDRLPGRQGRLLFAWLAAHRSRSTPRTVLLDVLWPAAAPAAAESALAALLAKLRRALGDETLEGRQSLRLALPGDAWVDLEAAAEALHRAESAIGAKAWARACMVESGLGLGGGEIGNAERAARRLVQLAPLDEQACRLLMRTLVARGNVAAALQEYERLRTAMREELGATPSALTQALHRQILTTGTA
jgi:SARP family transcriptional regulator, regulator of embCAB operon